MFRNRADWIPGKSIHAVTWWHVTDFPRTVLVIYRFSRYLHLEVIVAEEIKFLAWTLHASFVSWKSSPAWGTALTGGCPTRPCAWSPGRHASRALGRVWWWWDGLPGRCWVGYNISKIKTKWQECCCDPVILEMAGLTLTEPQSLALQKRTCFVTCSIIASVREMLS